MISYCSLLRARSKVLLRREFSNTNRDSRYANETYMPRGRGGRSSVSGKSVTLFGSSGIVGRSLLTRLGREGSQVILPHRCDEYFNMYMKLMADLGQFHWVPDFNIRDELLIRDCVKNSNIVVNCVGIWKETIHNSFRDVNVDFPALLARICREEGVNRLIHVTNTSAALDHPLPNLRTKAEGDVLVTEGFPDATIIRLATVFAEDDRFISYFSGRNKSYFPIAMDRFPSEIQKQPVYLRNVADAINNAMTLPDTPGRVYQLLGPKRYYLSDLVDFFARAQCLPKTPRALPMPRVFMGPTARRLVDNVSVSDAVDPELPGLEALGVEPTPLEKQVVYMFREARTKELLYIEVDFKVEPPPVIYDMRPDPRLSRVLGT